MWHVALLVNNGELAPSRIWGGGTFLYFNRETPNQCFFAYLICLQGIELGGLPILDTHPCPPNSRARDFPVTSSAPGVENSLFFGCNTPVSKTCSCQWCSCFTGLPSTHAECHCLNLRKPPRPEKTCGLTTHKHKRIDVMNRDQLSQVKVEVSPHESGRNSRTIWVPHDSPSGRRCGGRATQQLLPCAWSKTKCSWSSSKASASPHVFSSAQTLQTARLVPQNHRDLRVQTPPYEGPTPAYEGSGASGWSGKISSPSMVDLSIRSCRRDVTFGVVGFQARRWAVRTAVGQNERPTWPLVTVHYVQPPSSASMGLIPMLPEHWT